VAQVSTSLSSHPGTSAERMAYAATVLDLAQMHDRNAYRPDSAREAIQRGNSVAGPPMSHEMPNIQAMKRLGLVLVVATDTLALI